MVTVETAIGCIRRKYLERELRVIECIKQVRDIRRSSLMQAKKEVEGWGMENTSMSEHDYKLDLSKPHSLEDFAPLSKSGKAADVEGKSIIAHHWRKDLPAAKMLLELAHQGWIKPAEIVFPGGHDERM